MSEVAELVRRVDTLQNQLEGFRQQLALLRIDLQQLGVGTAPNGTAAARKGCLETAIALAEDLGPEFSSEEPHTLADWDQDKLSAMVKPAPEVVRSLRGKYADLGISVDEFMAEKRRDAERGY